ncbi:hypothetical protein LCGC14_2258460, partial [marine sediment metagenome]
MAKLKPNISIVDFLKSKGQESSFEARKKLATERGISDFTGSDVQNIKLLETLKAEREGETKKASETGQEAFEEAKAPISFAETGVVSTSDAARQKEQKVQ